MLRNSSFLFIERETFCEKLRVSCLSSSKLDTQRQQKKFVIYDLNESNKTQICLKFAKNYREKWIYSIDFFFRMMTMLQILKNFLIECEKREKFETKLFSNRWNLWIKNSNVFRASIIVEHIRIMNVNFE